MCGGGGVDEARKGILSNCDHVYGRAKIIAASMAKYLCHHYRSKAVKERRNPQQNYCMRGALQNHSVFRGFYLTIPTYGMLFVPKLSQRPAVLCLTD